MLQKGKVSYMFGFKKKEKSVLDFVKEIDLALANAYRAGRVDELKNGFSREAVLTINSDIMAHKSEDGYKYANEKLMNRSYEVVSEDDDKCVIRRSIAFKIVKGLPIGVDFSELLTVFKGNDFYIVSVVAA